jgi:hypothetical protein
MSNFRSFIITHLLLLILASTSLTAATVFMDGQINWQYFQYFHQTGWGRPYEFRYALPVVCAYLAAYATGFASYLILSRKGAPVIGRTGMLLCALGFASFAYELAHWFTDFYGSWIVSVPAPLMILGIVALIQCHYFPTGVPANQPPK